MTNRIKITLRLLFTSATALPTLFADTGSVLPVRELTAQEIQNLASYTALNGFTLNTAAYVDVQALNNGSGNDVERQVNNLAAVYRGVSKPNPGAVGAPAENAAPPASSIFDFKQSGDSAQAWATMRANGAPFLFTQAYGKSSASGTASWTAKLTMPGYRTLYTAIRLPAVTVTGNFEEDGPSRWQSRIRADLLVNGTVVWSSEASRFNVPNGTTGVGSNCSTRTEEGRFLNEFERPLGLTSNSNTASPTNTFYLKLGAFDSDQPVEVTLVVRADSVSQDKCCLENGELFCSRATTRVAWDSSLVAPVRFWTALAIRVVGPLPLAADQ